VSGGQVRTGPEKGPAIRKCRKDRKKNKQGKGQLHKDTRDPGNHNAGTIPIRIHPVRSFTAKTLSQSGTSIANLRG